MNSELDGQEGATPAQPLVSAANTEEADTVAAPGEHNRPAGGGDSAGGLNQKKTEEPPPVVGGGGGILDSKRPAASPASSDPKRRRRSSMRGTTSSFQYGGGSGGGGGGGATDPSSGAPPGGGPATESSPGLTLHPVFARRERAAREAESSKATAADVVRMAREVQALTQKVSELEGALVGEEAETAATTTVILLSGFHGLVQLLRNPATGTPAALVFHSSSGIILQFKHSLVSFRNIGRERVSKGVNDGHTKTG